MCRVTLVKALTTNIFEMVGEMGLGGMDECTGSQSSKTYEKNTKEPEGSGGKSKRVAGILPAGSSE